MRFFFIRQWSMFLLKIVKNAFCCVFLLLLIGNHIWWFEIVEISHYSKYNKKLAFLSLVKICFGQQDILLAKRIQKFILTTTKFWFSKFFPFFGTYSSVVLFSLKKCKLFLTFSDFDCDCRLSERTTLDGKN